MTHTLADRVKENTATTGTGDFTLTGAVNGFLPFSARLGVGDTTWYAAILGTQWEVGLGTLTGATNLQRTSVLASSNGDAAVNFSAGAKEVFIDFPASLAQVLAGFALAESSVASAATVDLGAQNGRRVAITGTAAITSFGTRALVEKLVRFTDACTLTYDATKLILPTQANIVTAAGDTMLATSDAAGNWRVRHYQRADGTPLVRGVYVVVEALGQNGYRKWSGGMIEQWGMIPGGTGADQTVTFPAAFPTACWNVTATASPGAAMDSATSTSATVVSVSKTGFTSQPRYQQGGSTGITGAAVYWRAIGN